MIALCAALLSLAPGCAGDPLEESGEVMGGSEELSTVKAQRFVAAGTRYDQLEAYATTGPLNRAQLDFTSDVTMGFRDEALRSDWWGTTLEVLPGRVGTWTEISSGKYGYVTGDDGAFPPAPNRSMLSSQVTARWKQAAMQSPAALIQYALSHRKQVETLPDADWNGKKHKVISISGMSGWPQPVRLYFDPSTRLPAKAETLEDDPVYGDALYEVAYGDWRPAGATRAPYAITETLAGSPLSESTRTEVIDDPDLDEDAFTVPDAMKGVFDQDLADWGKRSSQYPIRWTGFLFPFFDDASRYMMPPQVLSSAPGAQVLLYMVYAYNTMVVEMPTSIVVVEAPLYESVSSKVIADIKQRIPGKPIKYLASTHFHFDHSGGIRTYAAEGAELVVAAQQESYYRELIGAPHTLRPDALARNPRSVTIRAVADKTSITEGGRTVTFYNLPQSHSDGCLVAVVEDTRMLFTSDLYSPGALGPDPTGPEHPKHDLYARELLADLATLGIDSTKVTTFVGGHGFLGDWAELRIFAGQ